MRVLLIDPRFPRELLELRWAVDKIPPRKRAINPQLGLATPAALCPPHWEVEIVEPSGDCAR